MDSFVSYKKGRRLKSSFAFVRYKCMEGVQKVVKNLNGMAVSGCNTMVSLAKFDRGGKVTYEKPKDHVPKSKNAGHGEAKKYNEAFRDNRSYKEVVEDGGKQMKVTRNPEVDGGRAGKD